MDRAASLDRITSREIWDIAIIGGGATGMGIAIDAASRGYSTCLFEMSDFGKGTSSRSTKLIHGGVRYLQQGNLSLVAEALREREILRRNAPHLVRDLAFVVPAYAWWELPYYQIGLHVYDALSRRHGIGRSRKLSARQVAQRIPTLTPRGLRGGIVYFDAQFDDARLLIDLAHTAYSLGAAIVNYAPVEALRRDSSGLINGLASVDLESGRRHLVAARCVINAAGPFADSVRTLDDRRSTPFIAASRGAHVVLERSFLPGHSALIVPRTPDGRVVFAIPWHERTLIGTTDVAVSEVSGDPRATDDEIDFLLQTVGQYLTRQPRRSDVLSVFAGIRPLVRQAAARTAAMSRDHAIMVSDSRLLTICGGKWTTYRRMAQDAVDRAAIIAGLPRRKCRTASLHIHGWHAPAAHFGDLRDYGAAAAEINALIRARPKLSRRFSAKLPITEAQVVWAIRQEMARTLDDVLSRRTRCVILDASEAIAIAGDVAGVMAREMNRDDQWIFDQVQQFKAIAQQHVIIQETRT